MHDVRLGSTDLAVSNLALGTWSYGGDWGAGGGGGGDVVVGGGGGGGGGGGAVYLPTVIATVVCGLAWVPPAGVWLRTIPSCAGSLVSVFAIVTLKPESCSIETAVARSRAVTSGTAEVFGPFDTLSVIVEPLATSEFPDGL